VHFDGTAFATPQTIALASGLTVPNQVTIDGFSNIGSPNTAAFPAPDNAVRNVTLDGASCSGCAAISFPAGNSQPAAVKGLIIQNFLTGIFIQGSMATVTGNIIRNNTNGVSISGATSTQLNTIGGGLTSDRNIIGGNTSNGIVISGSSVINTTIDGNFIGTDETGTAANANATGISVGGAAGTLIGDAIGNLITGNVVGVSVSPSTVPSTIRKNLIGISGLGNSQDGLVINASGTTTEFNSFRSNGNGIVVLGGVGNVIRDNIYESNGLPVDLRSSTSFVGPTANDDGTGDSDSGGNNIQNYPLIASAVYDPQFGDVEVEWSFNSSSTSNLTYIIHLYKAEATGTNPGSVELIDSQCWVGNNFSFSPVTSFVAGSLAPGDRVIMTATGYAESTCPVATPADGTSEFSLPVTLVQKPGVVTNTNDTGLGSLRQAILDANSGACDDFGACDISFAIPTSDPGYDGSTWTIQPSTELPAITRTNVFINGGSQAGFIGGDPNPAGPEIVINGSLLTSPTANGFQVLASTVNVEFVTFQDLAINGFADNAIVFQGTGAALSRFHSIHSCYIGTDATGSTAVPNGAGVVLGSSSSDNQIGSGFVILGAIGKSSIASVINGGNIIGGNTGPGILIADGSFTYILGNFIGTDALGSSPLPNGVGIRIQGALATGITVGGDPSFEEDNIIAFNTGAGIEVASDTTGHNFDRNSIHSNGGLGIDLEPAGPTPNDLGDADSGANDLTNFPVITSVTYGASDTTVNGTMNGLPGASYEIHVYTSALPDSSGFGEGETYQASASIVTDGSGNSPWSVTFSGVHRWISATASHAPSALPVRTSEFSAVFNSAPVAVADTASTVAGTPVTTLVLSNDSDADGDAFTIISAAPTAANGTVSCTASDCTYTPNSGFFGSDSYSYTISDPAGAQASATVTVTVQGPPVAVDDTASTPSNTPVTTNVLSNDSDPESGALSITSFTQGSNGTVSCTAPNCTYTPNANFSGTDSYTYTISDPTALTDTATVTVTVSNQPPVAVDDTASTPSNTPVTTNVVANDTDPESGALSIQSFTQGSNGTVSCTVPNCTYTPNANFSGTDSYTYTISDPGGLTDVATVTVTVSNQPPVAVDDTASTP
jgi:hypothetical protein